MSFAGKICLVTGASRGIGKGIALELAQAGATVYITARTLEPKTEGTSGSLKETSAEMEKFGGKAIPVVCDHSKEDQIIKLFDQIKEEQGQLDLLVNNAYAAVNFISDNMGKPFWESDPAYAWDIVNNVGLRNHYICSCLASRIMVPQRKGLIVNISSGGGLSYLFNVAYGIGKQALDRMAADMAVELRKHNVACVSLWPGAVRTEEIEEQLNDPAKLGFQGRQLFLQFGESTRFAGRAVVGLLGDRFIMQKTGRIVLAAELANQYGFTDVDGKVISSMRSLPFMLGATRRYGAASWAPNWIKVPHWMLWLRGNKF